MGLAARMKRWKVSEIGAERREESGEAMRGIDVAKLDQKELLQTRGW